MAGELLGKVCEDVVYLSLVYAGAESLANREVKPEGLTTKCDFAIGESIDAPEGIILVTHSVSSMQSHKKFWRNMGELTELRTMLPTLPVAINIVFGTAKMEKLALITTSNFDLSFRIVDIPGGERLMEEIANLSGECKGKKRSESIDIIENNISSTSKSTLEDVGSEIMDCVKNKNIPEIDLWRMVKKNRSELKREAKITKVKRGSAKFLPFDSAIREEMFVSAREDRPMKQDPPALAKELGLVGRIGERFIVDEDMIAFARSHDLNDFNYLMERAPHDRLSQIAIQPLRALPSLKAYSNYLIENYEDLIKPEGMLRALEACHSDPMSLCELPQEVSNVWFVDYMITLAKARRGGHNKYGHSKLAEEAGITEGISGSGYRFFSDWVNRGEGVDLPDETLEAVATTLADELNSITTNEIEDLNDEIKDKYIRTYFEIKLLTYGKYDPLLFLLQRGLDNHEIEYQIVNRQPGVFGEYAGVNGGTSRALFTESACIYWQSAHGSHTADKKKELMGRATALRYTWNENKFVPRVEKLFLVVDGTWGRSELEALAQSGWEEIYYPDEIPELIRDL